MNLGLLAGATLALATLTPPAPLVTAEPVTLTWKLPENARYRGVSTMEMETTTIAGGQEQEESTSQTASRIIVVDEVTESGNMKLAITMESFALQKESAAQTISLTAERGEDGEVVVEVDIESINPMLEGEDVIGLFESLGEGMLELEFQIEVTPRGHVVVAEVEGDPFENLPTDTEITRIATQMIRMMITVEDLPAMLAAELFVQLPDEPVESKAEWPVRREMTFTGIEAIGTGTATLEAVESVDGARVAVLTETLEYEIDTGRFSEMMTDIMATVFAQMGAEAEVSMGFESAKTEARSSARFDVDGCCNRVTTWEDFRLPLTGYVEVSGAKTDMEVEVLVNGSFTWERLPEDR